MGIKHNFVSGKSDSADTSLVNPSDWNEDHVIDGNVTPDTDNAYSIGISGTSFSDLFLGDGGIIDWGDGLLQAYNVTDFEADGWGELLFIDTGAEWGGLALKATPTATYDGVAFITYNAYNGAAGYSMWHASYFQDSANTAQIGCEIFSEITSNTAGAFDTGWNFTWRTGGASRQLIMDASAVRPLTDDQLTIGTTTRGFADLYLGDGGIIASNNETFLTIKDVNASTAGNWLGGVATLDFGNTTTIYGAGSRYSVLQMQATDSGTGCPYFSVYVDDNGTGSAWGANGYRDNSSGSTVQYFQANSFTMDDTAGAEDSRYDTVVKADGSNRTFVLHGEGGTYGGQTGADAALNFGSEAFPFFIIYNSSNSSGGPDLIFYQNSSSPAANDLIGLIDYAGEDSASNKTVYCQTRPSIEDPTSGSEDGTYVIRCLRGGANVDRVRIGDTASNFNGGRMTFEADGMTFLNDVDTATGFNLYVSHSTASPADSDDIGTIHYTMEDSASNVDTYASFNVNATDVTSGTEDTNFGITYKNQGSDYFCYGVNTGPEFVIANDGSRSYLNHNLITESTGTGGPYLNLISDDNTAGKFVAFNTRQQNSAGNIHSFNEFLFYADDLTNGSEDGWYRLGIHRAGSSNSIAHRIVGNSSYFGVTAEQHFTSATQDYATFAFCSQSTANGGPQIILRHDDASPADGAVPGGYYIEGEDSGSGAQTYAGFYGQSDDVTAATEDGTVRFYCPTAGSLANNWILGGAAAGFYWSAATGGAKGSGTINAKAVYDDNSLLTCYVDEAVQTGAIDQAKWDDFSLADEVDDFVPSRSGLKRDGDGQARIHWGARKFAERLGTEYDPTKFANQKKHLKDKKHLTPYPNPEKYNEDNRPSIGGWVQRGIEMDELLFQYIVELEGRVAALEN